MALRFSYNQSHSKRLLTIGLLQILLGTAALFTGPSILTYFLGIGAFYVFDYFYKRNRPYVSMEGERIAVDQFFRVKTANIREASVTYFAGDYKITTPDAVFVINTNLLDPNSLPELKAALAPYLIESTQKKQTYV